MGTDGVRAISITTTSAGARSLSSFCAGGPSLGKMLAKNVLKTMTVEYLLETMDEQLLDQLVLKRASGNFTRERQS